MGHFLKSYKNTEKKPSEINFNQRYNFVRIPRMDWDRPPWNRWSFQHVREFMPTARVWRGRGPVRKILHNESDVLDITFQGMDGSTTSIRDLIEETYTDGFLVMVGGKIVHESYYNDMKADTPHLLQSVSKSITGTVAGMLIGDGALDPQQTCEHYLPDLKTTGYAGATVQHLLDMTSGVVYSEEYTKFDSDVGKTDVASGWRPVSLDADTEIDWPSSVWDQIMTLNKKDAKHGQRWQYRSIETDVLAHLMIKVSGQSLHELISERLWQPLCAEEDGYFTIDSNGYGLASGGFNCCLRDLGRFGQLYLDEGNCQGKNILPLAWINDVRRGAHGLFSDDALKTFPAGCYRNQFWIENKQSEAFLGLGVFGQLVYVAPKYNMVTVKLSSWPSFLNDSFKINTLKGVHAIAKALN